MPIPFSGQKILVFSPHPDDETIAAGGYLHKADQVGALVRVVLVTDGNKHGLEKQRYQEFHNATACLGIDQNQLEFWGYPDGGLKKAGRSLNYKVIGEIIDYKPDIILYSHPLDRHPDHAKLGRVVESELRVLSKEGLRYKAYRYLVHYWLYPRPLTNRNVKLVPPAKILGSDQKWEQYNLHTRDKEIKHIALSQYKTQLKNPLLKPLLVEFIRDNELYARYSVK